MQNAMNKVPRPGSQLRQKIDGSRHHSARICLDHICCIPQVSTCHITFEQRLRNHTLDVEPQSKARSCNFAPPCLLTQLCIKVSVEFLVPLLTIFCVHQSSLVTDLFIFEVTLLTKEYHHFHLFLISSLGS
ncbi:hypothetical protein V6N12_053835 [Hibiscus sabdariffa]|uniref:Uncharacterized protein n=1 Tax=Hibiscus sabdariffa TaxID=183260 RepID=A0ABR2D8R5_9ROSI